MTVPACEGDGPSPPWRRSELPPSGHLPPSSPDPPQASRPPGGGHRATAAGASGLRATSGPARQVRAAQEQVKGPYDLLFCVDGVAAGVAAPTATTRGAYPHHPRQLRPHPRELRSQCRHLPSTPVAPTVTTLGTYRPNHAQLEVAGGVELGCRGQRRMQFLGMQLRCAGTATSARRNVDRAVRYGTSIDASAGADGWARCVRAPVGNFDTCGGGFRVRGGRCSVCGGYCHNWGGNCRALVVSLTAPDQSLRCPGAPLPRTSLATWGM